MNTEDNLQAAGIFADLSVKITFRTTRDTGSAAQALLAHCISQVGADEGNVYITPPNEKTDPLSNRATIEIAAPLENMAMAVDLHKMFATLAGAVLYSPEPVGSAQREDLTAAYYFWGASRDLLLEAAPEDIRKGAATLVALVNNLFEAMGVVRD